VAINNSNAHVLNLQTTICVHFKPYIKVKDLMTCLPPISKIISLYTVNKVVKLPPSIFYIGEKKNRVQVRSHYPFSFV
jgi:hypothetical protein